MSSILNYQIVELNRRGKQYYCGIGAYVQQLTKHLEIYFKKHELRFSVKILDSSILNWSKLNNKKLVKIIKQGKGNCYRQQIIHIHLPNSSMNKRINPDFLDHFQFKIITAHSYTFYTQKELKIYQQYFQKADQIIFNCQQELNQAIKRFPFIRKKTKVISISSTIQPKKLNLKAKQDINRIICFGHLRKGQFNLFEIIKSFSNFKKHNPVLKKNCILLAVLEIWKYLKPS
ncbi:MAG: hypothetical protein GF332_00445 [Candidatus Moranbacteria bacterium]|nr:hypothetical protein [Candidatus Moranbacteria bacterium]